MKQIAVVALASLLLLGGCAVRNEGYSLTRLTIAEASERHGWQTLTYIETRNIMTVKSAGHEDDVYFVPTALNTMPLDDLRWVAKHAGLAHPVYNGYTQFVVSVHAEFRNRAPIDSRFVSFPFLHEPDPVSRVQQWYAKFAADIADDRLPVWRGDLREAVLKDRVAAIRASIPYDGTGMLVSYTLTLTRDGRASIKVPLLRPYFYRGPRVVYAHAWIAHSALREIELSALRLRPTAPVLEENDPGIHVTITTPDDRFQADGSEDWGYAIFAAHVNQFVHDAAWRPAVPWPQE